MTHSEFLYDENRIDVIEIVFDIDVHDRVITSATMIAGKEETILAQAERGVIIHALGGKDAILERSGVDNEREICGFTEAKRQREYKLIG